MCSFDGMFEQFTICNWEKNKSPFCVWGYILMKELSKPHIDSFGETFDAFSTSD